MVHVDFAARLVAQGLAPFPTAEYPPLLKKLRVIGVERLLVKVAVCAVLLLPTLTVPKARVAGESATGLIPWPDRVTICGELRAVLDKVMIPGMTASTPGVKVTLMVQVAEAGSVIPAQLSVSA